MADALDLAESFEAESGHQRAQASSPPAWWVDLVDRLHVLSRFHDECCTTEYYYLRNDGSDASVLFEAFKKACEAISRMIDAKMNEVVVPAQRVLFVEPTKACPSPPSPHMPAPKAETEEAQKHPTHSHQCTSIASMGSNDKSISSNQVTLGHDTPICNV